MAFERSDQSTISTKLKEILSTIPQVKTVTDKVRIGLDEWKDYELPAIQIYDAGDTSQHDRNYLTTDWTLNFELILKTTQRGVVDQSTLYDFRKAILDKLWEIQKLGLSQVVQVEYKRNKTGLHVLDPYYWSTLQIVIRYRERLK